ncbi:cyclase [Angomonas deanei]|uniref:Cyclase, putative n=1 Tax=Angomonas deanei TaxID=59799 RepID=S9VN73_9TRYP|nr:cyclase [Angomonas deanei]EPY42269.1 cyclase [Angomonas deanei]CAD2213475.1 Putative cyclase, putative [Angomonas deanei]|eukprot:EPY41556.1 cyclase [Angomonas deanei]
MIIDLTAPLYDGMPVYEGDPQVCVTTVRTIEADGWELRQLSMGSHTGTHVDAPSHMHAGSATLDDVPLDKFYGPAMLVSAETEELPRGVGLLFCGDIPTHRTEAILAANPPFVGGDLTEEMEKELLGAGIVTYTNLINLDLLPDSPFLFSGFPLRITGGDGSPVRAVAIV